MNVEVAVASDSGSAPPSPASTPGSSRLSRRSKPPKSPVPPRGRNPRWEGQTNVPVLDLLPDELLIRVHTYLDAPTIGVTAQTCKRFNEIANDTPLWKELFGRGEWSNKKNGAAQPVTRSYYVRKFLSYRREEKLREELELQHQIRENRNREIHRSSMALLWLLYGRPYEWICTIAVILFTIFVVLKLDNVVSWSWQVVFIPLILICYQMLFAPLVYDFLRVRCGCDFEDELAPEKTMRPIFFFLFFLMPLQSGRLLNRLLVFTPIVTLLAFFVLLLLRISGAAESVRWWVVVLPLILFAVYLTILPLVVQEPVWDDSKWLDHVLPCIGALLVLIFVLLLAVKLEGPASSLSWFGVMAPLFVLKGLFVVVPIVLTFSSHFCCDFWLEQRSRWPSADTGSYCIVAIAVVLLVLGPLLAFEILLAQYLEHERTSSFSLIFVPVFLLEGFGVCACFALNMVVLFE